jgi:hypothetical protein
LNRGARPVSGAEPGDCCRRSQEACAPDSPSYCPKQEKVAILLGADDQVRIWLNGAQVHENLALRPAIPDNDAVAATLTPGWNTLLARVVNVTGTHALYLRLSNAPADLARARGRTGE